MRGGTRKPPGAPGLRIRPAVREDLEAIARIQEASPAAAQWPPEDYLRYTCLVAVSGEEVAGFAVLRRTGEEYELLNLAVAPERRRRGVGRRLVAAVLERAPGPVFLEVRASNEAARRLYEACGFRPVGLRRNYYRNPTESAIVMRFQSC